ncbi:hypothetical protein QTP88_020272 [Uroleucon formosanum]
MISCERDIVVQHEDILKNFAQQSTFMAFDDCENHMISCLNGRGGGSKIVFQYRATSEKLFVAATAFSHTLTRRKAHGFRCLVYAHGVKIYPVSFYDGNKKNNIMHMRSILDTRLSNGLDI